MSNIKNLVFDFGGVFIRLSLQGCVNAFRELGFSDIDEYVNPYCQKGLFGDIEAGRITDEEFCRLASEHIGHDVSWADCQRGWLGFMVEVVQANLRQVLRLSDEGYQVALLSNTNPFIASWFRSDDFDGNGHSMSYYIPQQNQYLSYELKCMKPGREIFEKMLHSTGFKSEETMFIDDGETNLRAAERLGFHTFCPINGEEWGERLERALR